MGEGSVKMAPKTKIPVSKASFICDSNSPLFLLLSLPFSKHILHKHVLTGGPDERVMVSRFPLLDPGFTKAKLTSILHLAYLMPEEC